MSNENWIEHLKSCRDELNASLEWEYGDSKSLSHLYFAPIEERMSIHVAEKALNYSWAHPFHTSLIEQNQSNFVHATS